MFIVFTWSVFVTSSHLIDIIATDNNKHELQHPTTLIQNATVQLLRTLSVCSSMHAEHAQNKAVHTLCGLLRNIVDTGSNQGLSKFNRN